MDRACLVAYQQIMQLLVNKTQRADDKIQGEVNITSTVICYLNQLAEAELIEPQVNIQNRTRVNLTELNDDNNDQVATIRLEGLKPFGQFFIGPNWDKLLKYHQNLVNPPEFIYLEDTGELIDDSSNNIEYDNLLNIAWVIRQLKDNSDYNSDLEYVFLHHQKVDIPLDYDIRILSHSFETDSLKLLIDDEHHKSAKKSLFKAVICEMLSETKKEKRLEKLISEFDIFATRFALAFHSYVSDYSFDKIRKQFEEKRTEYVKKVNDVFQDIASKLIILPAPIWLALSQAKNINQDNAINYIQLYKNITIIIVVIAVSVILGIMILGQLKVLNSVKIEYTNLFKRLQHEFPNVKLDPENELKSLSSRHELVYWQLIAVQVINLLLCVFSLILLSQTF